jgi:hypothetical protein
MNSDMGVDDSYACAVERFGAVAERYCAIVDGATRLGKTTFLLQIYRILPEVISEAIRLPDTDPWQRNELDDPNEPDNLGQDSLKPRANTDIGPKAWQDLYGLLKEKLEDSNLYWQVFDPIKDSEAIRASLADDIADVYQDLTNGLRHKRENGAIPAEVVWEWRLLFYSHWGDHAIEALRTIHRLLGGQLEGGEIV